MKKRFLIWIIIAWMAVIIGYGCGGKQVTPVIVLTPTVTLTPTSPTVMFGGADTILVSLKNATSAEINGVSVSDGYKFIIPYFGSNLNGGDTTITCKATNAPSGGVTASNIGTCAIHIYDYFYKYRLKISANTMKTDSGRGCLIADTLTKPIPYNKWIQAPSDCNYYIYSVTGNAQTTLGPCNMAPLVPGTTYNAGGYQFSLDLNGKLKFNVLDGSGNIVDIYLVEELTDTTFIRSQVKNGFYQQIFSSSKK